MERTKSRNPVEMANILMAISIVSQSMADELLRRETTVHRQQMPPGMLRRRAERYDKPQNNDRR